MKIIATNTILSKNKPKGLRRRLSMQLPRFLPSHLSHYQSNESDESLFLALKENHDDLVLFFEKGCQDEQWGKEHVNYMRQVVRWAAKEYYLGNLSLPHTRVLVKTIQHHYSHLKPFLFFRSALFLTIKLKVEGQPILANSLLFGVCSPTLGSIFRRECFEKLNDEWNWSNLSLSLFRKIETYVSYGEITDLKRSDKKEVVELRQQAKRWGLEGLVEACDSLIKG